MNTRCRSAGGLPPVVAPQVTSRPPRRSDFSDSLQLASPTLSITISTPPPLISRIALRHSVFEIVDPGLGAHLHRACDLGVARRGDKDGSPDHLRQLKAGDRDAATNSDDQHAFAGLQRFLAEQHAPGREVPRHKGARGDNVGVVRQWKETATRHCDIVREAAVPMLAHDLHALAERLIAGQAVAALSAKRVRIEDRLHARLKAAIRRGLDHFACGFHAHHLRQRVSDAGPIVAHVEINAIERRSGDAQNGLAGRRSRIGKVAPSSRPRRRVAPTPQPSRSPPCFSRVRARLILCVCLRSQKSTEPRAWRQPHR